MNILIPDSWLREYLKTKATPKQIKEYLSLCGPSIDRTHEVDGEVVYDIEVTTNRPDAMSVMGIAREAAAILPRFNIKAKLLDDPYAPKRGATSFWIDTTGQKKLTIKTDPILNPRWMSVVFENVTVKPSPDWLRKKLEATGIRSLNNIIDITNYLLRAYGQPAHAFDFDSITDKKNQVTMILRASRKGEKLITLDGKSHTLSGDDIVIEDGRGKLIDLCGIMGAQNSAITEKTKTVILFLQTYDPMHIRRTMMNLAQRTEAGSLFEKGIDSELVLPAFAKGVELITELSGGNRASKLYDIYPKPYKPSLVSVSRPKTDAYIGTHLSDKEISEILTPLGFQTKVTKDTVTVAVPSFRQDVTIDVDIIEELARIYGYHNIKSKLPGTAPPIVIPDETLKWEEEIKIRLSDWGFTETYTYSMISEELMDLFKLDKKKAYKITNPLSQEWVYMRPHLTPSVLLAFKQNLNIRSNLKLFELSMRYEYRNTDLPLEKPSLVVLWSGSKFYEAKGLAEALFHTMGISIPLHSDINNDPSLAWYNNKRLSFGIFGSVGELNSTVLGSIGIDTPVTRLYLDIDVLVSHAKPTNKFIPIPKYPPSFEDLAFIVPDKTLVGPMVDAMKQVNPLIIEVTLLDTYENTRTFHITYQSKDKSLTTEEIRPIREKLIQSMEASFSAKLKEI